MIIFGHPDIASPKFVRVHSPNEIATVKAKDIVLFPFDFTLLNFCKENSVVCAVEIANKKEAVYANALDANYLLCKNFKLAQEIQAIANEYLFDAKVIVTIDERLIDQAIEAGIDGVYLTTTL